MILPAVARAAEPLSQELTTSSLLPRAPRGRAGHGGLVERCLPPLMAGRMAACPSRRAAVWTPVTWCRKLEFNFLCWSVNYTRADGTCRRWK